MLESSEDESRDHSSRETRGSVGGALADLHRLARLWGVATRYQDGFGEHRRVSPESLRAVLAALGAPIQGPGDVADALRVRRREHATRMVPPSAVAWEGRCPVLPVTVPASAAAVPVDGRLVFEAGEAVPFRLEADATPVVGRRRIDGNDWVRRRVQLADPLPPGHHHLEIEVGGNRGSLRCVSAPRHTHPHPESAWGVFLPLYALWAGNLIGNPTGDPAGSGHLPHLRLGDLGLLARLARWAGGLGASAVGCLPLLAGFLDADRRPFDPSPYAPASRLFWNELWADLAVVPELPECRAARETLQTRPEQATAEEDSRLVNYGAERAWRRPVWQALADRFFAHASDERREELTRLLEERPELASYAAFRATGDRLGVPWQEWPELLRNGELPESVDDPETQRLTRLHLYSQLVVHQQMETLRERAQETGTDLYLDLPLGVHASSYDVWRHRDAFARRVSAGAPPDAFFVRGQDWGFPPLSPECLRRDGPAHFRQVLAHSMGACGVLRLDHAMQLERLFWIPAGGQPTDGTYVRYPREELLATLVLESQRTRCAVVAEDLGTVSDGFREALERHRLARMFVLPFALRPNPFSAMEPVPAGSLAALDTHDTATFAGFWHGRDLELRRGLELLSAEDAEREVGYRDILRHALVAELRSRGFLSRVGEPTAEQVARAALQALAESPASWLLVNLEDLWGEEEPQNVPGTGSERPNWRRRAQKSLADLRSDPELRETLEALDRLRRAQEAKDAKDGDEEPGA